MTTLRQNLLDIYRRRGATMAPAQFTLCAGLERDFRLRHGASTDYHEHYGFAARYVDHPTSQRGDFVQERWFPGQTFKPGTVFDHWGIGHEPGSEAAHHMTRMLHPLAGAVSRADLAAYPFPDWDDRPSAELVGAVASLHSRGLAAMAGQECTVWETAWYLRGMDRLVADFVEDPEFAEDLLDRVTERSVRRARACARAGVDILCIGDDIGTQSRLMMSPATFRRWIKPRLCQVIAAAKADHPQIVVQYHSCGFVIGLIPDLIEAGIDVLNPVQPESMDFAEVHRRFGRDLSFNGAIGTQTVMPFGTPAEVRAEVHRVLGIAGASGGLVACPTHLLEPEVPWANIEAYAEACRDWRP